MNTPDLLAGPRGRRLCWIGVVEQAFQRRHRYEDWELGREAELRIVKAELDRLVAQSDLSEFSELHEITLLELFADTVDSARYWQNPDEIDVLLAAPELVDALTPVASTLAAIFVSSWFDDHLALDGQVYVDWSAKGDGPPTLKGAAEILRLWKRGADSRGRWGSPPIAGFSLNEAMTMKKPLPMLATTTQHRPALGAVGLLLQEDSCGMSTATCRPVSPCTSARIFEIDGRDSWRELVESYPVDVTAGVASSWNMASGLTVRWLLPDWSLVAEDYDVIHLPATRYLELSGSVIWLSGGACTLIAGWNPDESFWLNDMLELTGLPSDWESVELSLSRQWSPCL
jgi:hypothetical protein